MALSVLTAAYEILSSTSTRIHGTTDWDGTGLKPNLIVNKNFPVAFRGREIISNHLLTDGTFEYTFDNLVPGTSYGIILTLSPRGGNIKVLSWVQRAVVITVPAAPAGGTVSREDDSGNTLPDGTIRIALVRSQTPAGAPITDVAFERAYTAPDTTTERHLTPARPYPTTGYWDDPRLAVGRYRYRWRFVNANGMGGWSAWSSVVAVTAWAHRNAPTTTGIQPDAPVLSAPSDIDNDGRLEATAVWDAPFAVGTSVVSETHVQWETRSDASAPWPLSGDWISVVGSVQRHVRETFAASEQVRFRYLYENSAGISLPSPWSEVLTIPDAAAPDPPVLYGARDEGAKAVRLKWRQPNNNGSPITRTDIEYRWRQIGEAHWTSTVGLQLIDAQATYQIATDQSQWYGLTTLAAGREYQFRARFLNEVDDDPDNWSVWTPVFPIRINVVTHRTPSTPGNLRRVTSPWPPSGVLGLQWDASTGDPQILYQLAFDPSPPVPLLPTSSLSAQVIGLTDGTAYRARIRAYSYEGTTARYSPWSDWTARMIPRAVSAVFAPAAPGLVMSGGLADAVEYRMDVPPDTGGGPVRQWQIEQRVGSGAWSVVVTSIDLVTTTGRLFGLVSGSAHQWRARVRNSDGWSAYSPVRSYTPDPMLTVPHAITDVRGATGDTTVRLTWTVPTDGGSPLTAYEYRQRAGTTGRWGGWKDASIALPHVGSGVLRVWTIRGLTNGTTYTIQIRAVNVVGDGAASNTVTATPVLPGGFRPATTPLSLTVVPSTEALTLSWLHVSGDPPIAFDFDFEPGDTGGQTSRYGIVATSTFKLGDLVNGTAYRVRIRAYNFQGATRHDSDWSDWTPPWRPRTGEITSGAPTLFSLRADSTSIRLAALYPADTGGNQPSLATLQMIGPDQADWTNLSTRWPRNRRSPPEDVRLVRRYGTYDVLNLAPGANYRFRARVRNRAGWGAWSDEVTYATVAAPTAPHAVRDLAAVAGDRQATLSWTAPDDGGSPIEGYSYRHQRAGSWSIWTSRDDAASPITILGLTNDQTYTFQVRAYNAVGSGDVSNTATATPEEPAVTHVPAAVPLAPTVVAGDEQVVVTWLAPAGSVPLTYDVQVRTRSSSSDAWGAASSVATGLAVLTYTASGLTNAADYQVQVRALNTDLAGTTYTSAWSAWSATSVPVDVPTVPGPPAIRLTNATSSSVRTVRVAPADNGGASIDYYELQWRRPTDSDWVTRTNRFGAGYNNLNLVVGTLYRFRARAHNSVGWGAWSDEVTYTPAAAALTVPDAITDLQGVPGNVSVALRWTAPSDGGSAITGYAVRHRLATATTWTGVSWTATGRRTTGHTVTGLTNGDDYQFQVRAVNVVGSGAASNTVTAKPATVPSAPSAQVSRITETEIDISWTAPGDGGSAITSYEVEYREDGTGAWLVKLRRATDSSVDLTSLIPETTYQVRVRAVNAIGDGPWRTLVVVTLSAATAPAQVTSVEAINEHEDSIVLSWTAPGDGGSAITSYEVEYREDGTGTWSSETVTALVHRVDGLTADTDYEIRVRAVNEVGDGPWSSILDAETTASLSPPPLTVATLGSVTFADDDIARWWTGTGDLEWNSQTYTGLVDLIDISLAPTALGQPNRRATLSLRATDPPLRAALMAGRRPVAGTARILDVHGRRRDVEPGPARLDRTDQQSDLARRAIHRRNRDMGRRCRSGDRAILV